MASAASPAVFVGTEGVAARACPDPIHAALAAVRAAESHLRAVTKAEADDDSDEAEARFQAAGDEWGVAHNELEITLPTTLAGLAALASYYAHDWADTDAADALDHLAEALAGVSATADLPPALPPVLDPVFTGIRQVREAEADLAAALRVLDWDDPERLRRADEAADRSSDARGALSAVRPITRAGLRALVRFHAADIALLEPETYGSLACRDIARALDALSVD